MNTPKVITLVILLLFLTFNITAQITIDGTITDSDSNPISNALVEIIDQNDTSNNYRDFTNESGYFAISNITDISSRKTNLPSEYIVLRNYPNPFNPSTIIYYELPKAENIEIKIYDILGREVRTLYNSFHKAGTYTMAWDGRNSWNSPVAAGIYFCQIKTKDNFKVHKMALLDGGSISSSVSNNKLNKSHLNSISKINNIFNFAVKVSGNDILESEFNYLSCSSDTTINLLVPIILQTANIGPEGGKLETEDFSLTIPEGAFSENATLYLALNPNLHESFSTAITKVYRIDSFPNLYSKPLKIKLKCIGELEDSYFLGLGYKSIDPTTGNDGLSFNFFEAEDSSGYMIATLTSANNSIPQSLFKSADFLQLKAKLFMGLAGYGAGEDSKHFSFFSSKLKYISLSYPIVESAEKAFNDFCDILNLDKIEFWNKYKQHSISSEIDIYTYNSLKTNSERPNRYCIYHLPYIKDENIKNLNLEFDLKIDDSKVNQSELDNLLRDLYHYIYFLFPVNQYTDNYELTNQFWLHHAIAAWSEELYSFDNFNSPLDFNLHYNAPFGGMQKFLETSPNSLESHGIGMSAVIKHLTNVNGNSIVGKFFNGLKSNPNALEVILDTLNYSYNSSESNWWPNFFKEYLQGNIYNVPSKEFLKNITETINFNDDDTLKYADKTYNDLSAKLFRININSEEIKNSKSLNFKLGPESLNLDYVKVLVFGIRNNNLVFISEGIDVSLGNLYQFDGLIACVVNSGNEPPYTGTSEIKLDIRAKEELQFNACKIEINVIGVWERHRIPPPPNTSPTIDTMGYRAEWNTLGNFTGNTFEGVLEKNEYGAEVTGKVKIELGDQLNISSFSVEAKSHYDDENSQWDCAGIYIGLQNKTNWNMYFDAVGESTCNSLTKVYYYHESPPSITGVIPYSKLIDYYCDENSYIKVTFYKKSLP